MPSNCTVLRCFPSLSKKMKGVSITQKHDTNKRLERIVADQLDLIVDKIKEVTPDSFAAHDSLKALLDQHDKLLRLGDDDSAFPRLDALLDIIKEKIERTSPESVSAYAHFKTLFDHHDELVVRCLTRIDVSRIVDLLAILSDKIKGCRIESSFTTKVLMESQYNLMLRLQQHNDALAGGSGGDEDHDDTGVSVEDLKLSVENVPNPKSSALSSRSTCH